MSELLKLFNFTAEQAYRMAKEQSVADAPIVIGDVTVIPVSKLSCGFVGGGSDPHKRGDGLAAGASVSIKKTPLSFVAVCGGELQILRVSEEDAKKKGIMGALLPLVEKFKEKKKKDEPQPE